MIGTIILALLLGLVLAAYFYLTKNRGVVESWNIPMVKPLFCFGSPPFLFNKMYYHEYILDTCKKLGRTWGRYDGVNPCLVTIDPDIIKQIVVKNFDNFSDTFDISVPENLTTLDISSGDTWRGLRKILSPTFTTGKMKGMLEPIEGLADRTIDYIREKVDVDNVFDIKPIVQGFTLDTIAKVGFGIDTSVYKGESGEFAETSKDVFASFVCDTWTNVFFFNFLSHFPFIAKHMNIWPPSADKIREMTHDIMETRDKQNIQVGDFIDRLRDEREKVQHPVTKPMLEAQGIIFLTAGFETTANTLGFMMYRLSSHPDVQEKIFEEISNVVGDGEGKSAINHETIRDMNYLEATIMETLRMSPPATEHDRMCTKACTINGMTIPRGTRMQLPIYAAHYDEEFFPEPHLFKPERFLKENEDKIVPYTWRPFGSGNRVCIGQRFSMIEMKIFMAKFLTQFKIVDHPDAKIEHVPGSNFLLIYPKLVVKLENRR